MKTLMLIAIVFSAFFETLGSILEACYMFGATVGIALIIGLYISVLYYDDKNRRK